MYKKNLNKLNEKVELNGSFISTNALLYIYRDVHTHCAIQMRCENGGFIHRRQPTQYKMRAYKQSFIYSRFYFFSLINT